MTIQMTRAAGKQAGIDVEFDDVTGNVLAYTVFNATTRFDYSVVLQAGVRTVTRQLPHGMAPLRVVLGAPLDADTFRWTLTG